MFDQAKQSVIISNKHGIYELPHELLIDVRLRKREKSGKSQNLVPYFIQHRTKKEIFH